jgi:peptidoglycan/LPS O-acetylase OafA/YrhL
MATQSKTDYYVAVDGLRGLAACAVLVVHYRHFFMEVAGSPVDEATVRQMPFQPLLAPVYESGHLAVQLFWLISGLVFAAAYLGRTCSGREFAVARVARLYPLHFLTLLLVALLQLYSVSRTGGPQIYLNNSANDFAAQLFMASNWHGFPVSSFNFPIWSVSMEIVIYAVFWSLLPLIKKHPISVIGIIVVAGTLDWIVRDTGQLLFQCALFFFFGCFCQQLLQRFGRSFGVILVISSVFGLAGISLDGTLSLAFLCASLVTACAGLDTGFLGKVASRFRWLGDSAYGIYLWHVPVQIGILLALTAADVPKTVAFEPWFFLMFMALVLIMARISFVYFETPARLWVQLALSKNGFRKNQLEAALGPHIS